MVCTALLFIASLTLGVAQVMAAAAKVPKIQCSPYVSGTLILQAYGTFDRPPVGLSKARTLDHNGDQARYLVSDNTTTSEQWAFTSCTSKYMGWESQTGLHYGQFRKIQADGSLSKHCLSAQDVNPKRAGSKQQLVTFSNNCDNDDSSQRLVTWQLYQNDYTGTYNGKLQSTSKSSGEYNNFYLKRFFNSKTSTTELRFLYDPDQDRRREDSNPYYLSFLINNSTLA